MILAGFKLADDDGHGQPGDQGDGQFEPVVRMELQFGKQIGAGDTEKRAGAKRQRVAEQGRVGGKVTGAQVKQRRANRACQREQAVQDVPREMRFAAGGHQG